MSRPLVSLTLKNFGASYDGFVALRCDEMSVKGNVIGLIGHNGAGKSTLMRSILGLVPISTGSLETRVQRDATEKIAVPEQHMAFCPETGSVFADITVKSYIELWCRFKQRSVHYYQHEGKQFIEALEVSPLLQKLGRELSKGQRRRVQMAIGFMMSPELFLLDEPFDGLDVRHSDELAELLAEESKRRTFIISSHRLDVVERIADSIVLLENGSVRAFGDTSDVCHTIAGDTFHIVGSPDPEDLGTRLQNHFPTALIHRSGTIISIVGSHDSVGNLKTLTQSWEQTELVIKRVAPTLPDSVSYHLRQSH